MKPRFLLTLLLAIALFSCGTDGTDDGGSDQTPQPTEPPRSLSDIERALSLMPDTAESRTFTRFNDWEAIADAYGVTPPGEDADLEDVNEFRLQVHMRDLEGDLVNRGEEWLSGFNREYAGEFLDTDASLGFDSRDIDFSVTSGEGGAKPYPLIELVMGEIDGATARGFLDECDMCPEPPETVNYAGETFYSWREDFISNLRFRLEPPLFDQVGRGGRLFVADDHAARTMRTADMEAVLEVRDGTRQSLMDIEEWSLAAAAMSDLNAVSGVFTDRSDLRVESFPELLGMMPENIDNFPEETRQRYEDFAGISATAIASAPALPEFEVAATGAGWEGEEMYAAMAVVFADEATAERGLEALRERAESGLFVNTALETDSWSELIDTAEFSIDGRVVSARIDPAELEEGQRSTGVSPFIMTVAFFVTEPFVPFLLR